MTKEEKALAACKEYDRLMTAIRKNTDDISDAMCDRIIETGDLDGHGNVSYIHDGKKTHLAEAFESYDGGSDFPVRCYKTPEEIAEIIGDCEGCKKAYEAVQDRKSNRKKLGSIKRTIRAIGRAA